MVESRALPNLHNWSRFSELLHFFLFLRNLGVKCSRTHVTMNLDNVAADDATYYIYNVASQRGRFHPQQCIYLSTISQDRFGLVAFGLRCSSLQVCCGVHS